MAWIYKQHPARLSPRCWPSISAAGHVQSYIRKQHSSSGNVYCVSAASSRRTHFEGLTANKSSINHIATSQLLANVMGKKKEKTIEERLRETKLLFDVPLQKDPLIYSPKYDITFLGLEKLHPFDSTKWGGILQHLMEEGIVDCERYVIPEEASEDDLLLAHTRDYLNSLNWSYNVAAITEVAPVALLPNFIVQHRLLSPFRLQVGGTVLGAKLAVERGWAINIGGGFHHASGSHGGGFCAYADISLAVQFAFGRLGVSRVMIIDLDAHQGNGHGRDFTNEERVYIFDMYNGDIYPRDVVAKRGIRRRVELRCGASTEEFLGLLETNLEAAGEEFSANLIIYNAGTDILEGDSLGMLMVSAEGVKKRDEMVFSFARRKGIPILMVTSGGYQKNNAKVIADSIINLSNKQLITLSKSGKPEQKSETEK